MLRIREAIMAESLSLPALGGLLYRYVVAGNGLFIQAEDSRLEALVQVSTERCHGLVDLEPKVHLKIPRIPASFLEAVLASARRHLPYEAMYQLLYRDKTWRCVMPPAEAKVHSLAFQDDPDAVVDLHSHASLGAFFSQTDDQDEQGFRIYAVIGKVDTDKPVIKVRVGVYGHHCEIDPLIVFEGLGPFTDEDPEEPVTLEEEIEAFIETHEGGESV